MIDRVNILHTLKRLDAEYNNNMSDPDLPQLFSKLAVIEFCGWIEDSYDTILYDYIDKKIIDAECIKIIKGFVKDNNGFAYKSHTFKTFSIVLGANNWENILDKLGPANKASFESILSSYKDSRNSAAHTNVKGSTKVYNSPSLVICDFQKLLPILLIIENEVNNLI